MSLLSDTQGRVDRVRSLVRLLEAHGGELPRDEVERWLLPSAIQGSKDSTVVNNTIGAARSLKLVATEAGGAQAVRLTGRIPSDWPGFLSVVYRRLAGPDCDIADEIMLRAYAYVVLRTEQEDGSTAWLESSVDTIASAIDEALRPAQQTVSVFNKSKWAAWTDWMLALGLSANLKGITFYPDPVVRLTDVLRSIGDTLGYERELEVAEFLEALSTHAPYLDGGTIFASVSEQMRYTTPPGRISTVLSTALRDLQDDGRLSLRFVGDSRKTLALAHDPVRGANGVTTVIIRKG